MTNNKIKIVRQQIEWCLELDFKIIAKEKMYLLRKLIIATQKIVS